MAVAAAAGTSSVNYHDKIKNLFSGGTAAATNSPLAFMERTSISSKALLEEQSESNSEHLQLLRKHTQLLKEISEGTRDTFGLKDLIVGKFLTRFLGGSWKALGSIIAGAGGGILTKLGIKSLGVGRIAGALKGGISTMFGGITNLVTRTFSMAFRKGQAVIAAIGRPINMLFKGLSQFSSTSGYLAAMTKSVTKLMPLLKGGGRLLGKIAWPITAIFGILDSMRGFRNADEILGKGKLSLVKKLQVGLTEAVDGFLLGIPTWLSRKLGFGSYSQLFDKTTGRLTDFVFGGVSRLMSYIQLPSAQELLAKTGQLKDGILGIGTYLKDSVLGLVQDLKGWFSSSFDRLRSALGLNNTAKGGTHAERRGRAGRMTQPHPSLANPQTATPPRSTGKSGRLQRTSPDAYINDRINQAFSATNQAFNVPGVASRGVDKSPVVVSRLPGPAAENQIDANEAAMSALASTSLGKLPPEVRQFYSSGINAMTAMGATMAATQAAGTAVVTDEVKKKLDKDKAPPEGGLMAKAREFYESVSAAAASESGRIVGELGKATTSFTDYVRQGKDNTTGGATDYTSSDFGTKGSAGSLPQTVHPLTGAMTGPMTEAPTGPANKVTGSATLPPSITTLKTKPGNILQTTGGGAFTHVDSAGKGWTVLAGPNGYKVKRTGARNWRNNNPGNMEYRPLARKYGAIGTDGRFAVFPDYETGHKARERLIFESDVYKGKSLQGMIYKYAPPSENNSAWYLKQVTDALGLPASTKLSDLSPEQRKTMLDAMEKVEGFKAGSEKVISGAPPTDLKGKTTIDPAISSLLNPGKIGLSKKDGFNVGTGGWDKNDYWGMKGNGSTKGVDPRLTSVMQEALKTFPLRGRVLSGRQGRGKGVHSHGNAMDITLYDQDGNALPNYQNPRYFRAYQLLAQHAYLTAKKMYPELTDGKGKDFNWGGMFGDAGPGRYKYGSNDAMDFRLETNNKFRAGSIMGGLNKRHAWYANGDLLGGQAAYSPEAFAKGMKDLENLRLSPEDVKNRVMRKVARASGSLEPRRRVGAVEPGTVATKSFKTEPTMTHTQFAYARTGRPSSAIQARSGFQYGMGNSVMPNLAYPTKAPEIKGIKAPKDETQTADAVKKDIVKKEAAAKVAEKPTEKNTALDPGQPAPKLDDIASMDEMKMLMINSSVLE